MKSKLFFISFALICFGNFAYSQNDSISIRNFDITFTTGFSRLGTKAGIGYALNKNISFEFSYGVDFVIIPFYSYGFLSDRKIYGGTLYYYPFSLSNYFLSSSIALYGKDYDTGNVKDLSAYVIALGNKSKDSGGIIWKIGWQEYFQKKSPIILNLEFGFNLRF